MIPTNIIQDIVSASDVKKGGKLPVLPVPDLTRGELVVPSHLDRLPDDVKIKIQRWLQIEGKSYREICKLLRDIGYEIQHIKLFRWCKIRFRGVGEVAAPILQEENRLEIERKAVYSMIAVALETIRKTKPLEITSPKDFEAMAGAVAKLMTAMANRDRIDHERDAGLTKALELLKMEIQRDLLGKPELVNQLLEIAEQSTEKLSVTGGK